MSPRNRDLYDAAVPDWQRDTPLLLSDFTARPRVIQAMGNGNDLHLLRPHALPTALATAPPQAGAKPPRMGTGPLAP
jgi:hypothetical protein